MSNFWKKFSIWAQSFKIAEIVEYVKSEYSQADEAIKTKSTWQILDYIYSLLQDAIKFYKEINNIVPETKAKGSVKNFKPEYDTEVFKSIASAYRK